MSQYIFGSLRTSFDPLFNTQPKTNQHANTMMQQDVVVETNNDDDTLSPIAGSRFSAWTSLTIFSAVSLAAHVSAQDGAGTTSAEKWVTSVCSISMSISFCAVLAHFVAKANFVDTPTEGGVAFFIVVFWAAGLPVIMKPDNAIATNPSIVNANLYFFSWASFIANLYILAEIAKNWGVADVYSTPPKTAKWYGLFAASVIVMGSSARLFSETFACRESSTSSTCRRTAYAISLGAISTCFCMVMSFLSSRAGNPPNLMLEMCISFLLFVMYAFGVGFITFGSGPGTILGNLYFSTWAGFIIVMVLLAECMKQFHALSNVDIDEGTGPPPPVTGDFEGEEEEEDQI